MGSEENERLSTIEHPFLGLVTKCSNGVLGTKLPSEQYGVVPGSNPQNVQSILIVVSMKKNFQKHFCYSVLSIPFLLFLEIVFEILASQLNE